MKINDENFKLFKYHVLLYKIKEVEDNIKFFSEFITININAFEKLLNRFESIDNSGIGLEYITIIHKSQFTDKHMINDFNNQVETLHRKVEYIINPFNVLCGQNELPEISDISKSIIDEPIEIKKFDDENKIYKEENLFDNYLAISIQKRADIEKFTNMKEI